MTKSEFLAALRNNLKGLPKEEVDDRINFYEEMINDRIDEGKTEEEAVADIGTTDDAVRQIASQTSLVKLVANKMKPKRQISGWEIAIIILGFPLWFPLLITAFTLCFVGYILVWVAVIVTYSIEAALIACALTSFVGFISSIAAGSANLVSIGLSLAALGGACLFINVCISATKGTYEISKRIVIGIKSKIIRKGGNENE